MTMPGFLSDDELATRADAIFRTGDAVEPAAWQTSAVTDANASAWGAIVSGLTARGYTLEEILMWVEGPAFQGDLGEYFLSLRAKLDVGQSTRDFGTVKALDRREELKTLLIVTAAGVLVVPTALPRSSAVGHGEIKNTGSRLLDPCTGLLRRW
jgi:hypothetical protein